MLTPSRFIVLETAQAAAVLAVRLASAVSGRLSPAADQLTRAALSVPLNLAEGAGRAGKDRINHYRIAYGSAREASVALALLRDLGAVDITGATRALALFDQVQAVTWRLTHPQ